MYKPCRKVYTYIYKYNKGVFLTLCVNNDSKTTYVVLLHNKAKKNNNLEKNSTPPSQKKDLSQNKITGAVAASSICWDI